MIWNDDTMRYQPEPDSILDWSTIDEVIVPYTSEERNAYINQCWEESGEYKMMIEAQRKHEEKERMKSSIYLVTSINYF